MSSTGTSMRVLAADHALLPGGWTEQAWLLLDGAGAVVDVGAGAPPVDVPVERVRGAVVPGIPNVHSHAFQRAMAGAAEVAGADTRDSFWSWRTRMYALANRITPDDAEAVAAQLYVEMLRAGFTSVGEFHYVHHAPDGTPYDARAEMCAAVLRAAQTAGIRMTLLPVLYMHGGVGAAPLPHQRRFVHADVDAFLRLVEDAQALANHVPGARVGVAPHSLRAVAPDELSRLVEAFPRGPIHIHVAEQPAEVDAVLAAWGRRPVQQLLEVHGADARWCLVHATHVTREEVEALASSGAVAGLCPTTEANLGDGIFPAEAYLAARGAFAVGSDSHVVVDAAEELRLLEAGQRLLTGRRNVLAGAEHGRRVGATLLAGALKGGATALDQPVGWLAPGRAADLLVLDVDHPRLLGRVGTAWLDAWLLASGPGSVVRHVMVRGQWVVRDGIHVNQHAVLRRFASAMHHLGD